MIGTTISHYQINTLIGSGGFSSVYKAVDRNTGKTLALKILKHDIHSSQSRRERFKREIIAYKRLSHPNIIRVYGGGFLPDGRGYIAMRYMKGGTLRDLMYRQGVLDRKQLNTILQDVASGLDYAHSRGVIHRDIKPENVLLYENGRACLGDFGTTRIVGMRSLTQRTDNIGTLHYMSPEHIDGLKNTTWKSDLYSLGVVTYEMMTGRPPFYNVRANEIPKAIKFFPPVAPRQLNPSLSPQIEQALLKGIAKQPESRYNSGQELYATIFQQNLPTPPVNPTPTTDPGQNFRQPEVWIAIGLVCVLLFLLFMLSGG